MQEAQYARTEEGGHRAAERPEQRRLIRVIAPALPDHGEGEEHHREERQRLDGRDDRADPLPIGGRADPVIVMASAEDAENRAAPTIT